MCCYFVYVASVCCFLRLVTTPAWVLLGSQTQCAQVAVVCHAVHIVVVVLVEFRPLYIFFSALVVVVATLSMLLLFAVMCTMRRHMAQRCRIRP